MGCQISAPPTETWQAKPQLIHPKFVDFDLAFHFMGWLRWFHNFCFDLVMKILPNQPLPKGAKKNASLWCFKRHQLNGRQWEFSGTQPLLISRPENSWPYDWAYFPEKRMGFSSPLTNAPAASSLFPQMKTCGTLGDRTNSLKFPMHKRSSRRSRLPFLGKFAVSTQRKFRGEIPQRHLLKSAMKIEFCIYWGVLLVLSNWVIITLIEVGYLRPLSRWNKPTY